MGHSTIPDIRGAKDTHRQINVRPLLSLQLDCAKPDDLAIRRTIRFSGAREKSSIIILKTKKRRGCERVRVCVRERERECPAPIARSQGVFRLPLKTDQSSYSALLSPPPLYCSHQYLS